jgi:class 3 adenylate cyclase
MLNQEVAMAKKDDKNNNEHKVQDGDVQESSHPFYSGSLKLPEDTIKNILGSVKLEPLQVSLPSLEHIRLTVPPTRLFLSWTPREQELEDEISKLKKENTKLLQEIGAKDEIEQRAGKEIESLRKNIEELEKKQRLQHLLYRVNENARKRLLESQDFRDLFEKSDSCNAVIISVDIRRSTELMLKARAPQLYADFVTSLCTKLTSIILDNYGVFDKFTGDGILAFFPEFYSGQDSPYWAIKAAHECHDCFFMHYRANRNCFKSILIDVGLGIGIDYGESHLVKIQDGFTVIGTPVVYACRMSGAQAGQTVLNQAAYEVMSQRFGEYVNFQESEIDIKHEGRTLAYVATLSKNTYEPKLPGWVGSSVSPKK